MKKNKILIISHLYPSEGHPTNGIFVHKMNLALRSQGPKLTVISPRVFSRSNVSRKAMVGDISVLYPRYFSFSRYLIRLSSWFALRAVRKKIKDKNPDLILAHTALPDGYIAKKLSRRLKIPYFVYIHGADVQHKINFSHKTKELIIDVLAGAKKVFVNSSKTKRLVGELGIDSVIIPMGVDEINKKDKIQNTKMVRLISVCNLQKEKGIQYAIEAVKNIKREDLEYLIIGSGSYEPELKKLAKPDKRIKFLGRLGQKEVFDNLQKSDIFVLPSYNEAFGVAYLEAMSFGLPIIGIKGQGVEDIVAKGECGILVESQSTEAVRIALEKMISDKTLTIKMGQIGQKIVSQNYLWYKITKKFIGELIK